MSMLKKAARMIVPEPVYDMLRRSRQARMTRSFKAYGATYNYSKHPLKVLIADPVGADWYDRTIESNPEIEFLSRFDLKGATVFDLGAHQCVIAMLLGNLVGPQGKVVAVEANAHNYQVALRNISMNAAENVRCVKGLISSGRMNVSIDGGLNGRARAASGPADTEVLTIDQMSSRFGAPSLVFLDIEGHEIEALSAAAETITATASHWFIELHGDEALSTYGHRNADIFRFFSENEFKFHMLDEASGEFVPLTREGLPTERVHVFFERRNTSIQ